MRKDLPAYPAYKESGIEWIGEVPEEWDCVALKRLVLFQRGHDLPTEKREDGDVPVVSSAGPSSFHSTAIANGPAVVTGRYGTIGEFYFVSGPFWPLNTTLYSIDLRGNDGRFVFYALKHYKPLFKSFAAKSAVPGVDRNDIHEIGAVVPPLPEQEAIVAFLDRETAKIDRLKDVRRRQIEVLREQRAAVIHHAVTQGLDPDAPKKDSGISWLGEVPEHWEVRRLKTVSRIVGGGTPSSSVSEYWEGDVTWICPPDLGKANQDNILSSNRSITEDGRRAANLELLPAGSLVISTRAPVGSLGLLGVEATTNQGCKGVVFDLRLMRPRYCYFLLQSSIVYMNAVAQGATFVEISGAQLRDLGCLLPPLVEQEAIVAHIDAETATIDALIGKYERELELLDEYRASLISHAVTGKIDVRGLVDQHEMTVSTT